MTHPQTDKSAALAAIENGPPVVRYELSVQDVVAQVEKIQLVMKAVMKEDVHYGVIPGTGEKPTLLKAGAEKLCLTFRLDPQYEVMPESVVRDDLIRYVVRCVLYHIPTGERVASGIGSCTSREAKYRYRLVATDQKPDRAEADRLKAMGLGRWKKVGSEWVWHTRIENDNPADADNTILKMACKRALVAAVLNGTAASDFFTQDVEDLPEFAREDDERPASAGTSKPVSPAEGGSTPGALQSSSDAPGHAKSEFCTDPQVKAIVTIARKLGRDPYAEAERILGKPVPCRPGPNGAAGEPSLHLLTKREASQVIDSIQPKDARP